MARSCTKMTSMEGSPSPEQLASLRARQLDEPVPEDTTSQFEPDEPAGPALAKRVSSATLLGVTPPISVRELLDRAAKQKDQPVAGRLGVTQFGRRSPLQIRRDASNDTRPAALDPAKTVPLAISRKEVLDEGRRILEGRRAKTQHRRPFRLPERFRFMLSVLAGCLMGVVVAVTGVLAFRSQSSERGAAPRKGEAVQAPARSEAEPVPLAEPTAQATGMPNPTPAEEAPGRPPAHPSAIVPSESTSPRSASSTTGTPVAVSPAPLTFKARPSTTVPVAPASAPSVPSSSPSSPSSASSADGENTPGPSADGEQAGSPGTEASAKNAEDPVEPPPPRRSAPLPLERSPSLSEPEARSPARVPRAVTGPAAARPSTKKPGDAHAQPGPDAVLPLSLD